MNLDDPNYQRIRELEILLGKTTVRAEKAEAEVAALKARPATPWRKPSEIDRPEEGERFLVRPQGAGGREMTTRTEVVWMNYEPGRIAK